MNIFSLRAKRGFTLIELLVVIAIIGILSSIVLASLNGARQKARDAKRESDLKQIQSALELYANDNNGTYPSSSTQISLDASNNVVFTKLVPTYITSLSSDPLSSRHYQYITDGGSVATKYCLGANLEGNAPNGAATYTTCSGTAILPAGSGGTAVSYSIGN